MSLMIMLLKKSYRIAERMHSFLSIPVGEDAAQCYASLLQLQFIAVVYRTIQNFYDQEFEGLQRCYIVVT